MIIKNLILIKNYNLLKKNLKRIIFLNEYHFSLFKKKKISNKLQYSILPKINYSKNERLKAYNECEKIYNSVIKDLVKSLNKIHNLDKTRNYWEIIIAHFLQRYIHICYYNYSLLKLAFRNKKDFYNIYSVNSKNLSMHNMFTFDLIKKADDYSWNFKLISKMIKFFKFNSNFIYKRGNFKTPTYKQENKFNKYLIFIIKFFDYLLSIFSKKKDILFYHSGIPFFLEKKIEIILGQVPRLISLYNLKFKFKNYDDVLRKQIILNEKKRNILENFIRNSLPLVLPISIVESFKDLLKMTNFNLFPKKPKIIFTAYKYDYDDFFKIYTAEKIQNNCKFFIYQHGNNYFTSIDGKNFPELKIANLFLTWGIKEKKNQYPFFNIAIHNRASFEKKFNKKGGLTIISHTGSHRVKIWDKFDDGLISAKSTLKILKQLDKKILKNTILKLFPGNNFLDQMIYKKFYKNLNIARIENKKSFFELHKETKLFLFNYDSTGLLQNLLLNIPSVAYWDYTFNNINTKYIKYYNLLIDAKILFTKKEQLIEHINKNWENIDKWWFKKDVQDKILKFNLKINNYADKKKLLKLIAHLKK